MNPMPEHEEHEIEVAALAAHLAELFGDEFRRMQRDEVEAWHASHNHAAEHQHEQCIISTAMLAGWDRANSSGAS